MFKSISLCLCRLKLPNHHHYPHYYSLLTRNNILVDNVNACNWVSILIFFPFVRFPNILFFLVLLLIDMWIGWHAHCGHETRHTNPQNIWMERKKNTIPHHFEMSNISTIHSYSCMQHKISIGTFFSIKIMSLICAIYLHWFAVNIAQLL